MKPQQGLLEVALLEARDLVAADLRGTSDPFVSLHCGNEKRTTKVCYALMTSTHELLFYMY